MIQAVRKSFWAIMLLAAAVIHFGTAALRINSLQPRDFSSYYAAAWSVRLNGSPYHFSPELISFLAKTQDLAGGPPGFNGTPLWAWLLQPLTVLPFTSAASLWMLVLFALAVCCHVLLVETAGYRGWKIVLATLPVTITFGPMFLGLTLGQNVVLLLLCALLMGKALKNPSRYSSALWIPLWIVSVAGKIFPVLWLGCLPFVRRSRTFLIASCLCIAAFAGAALLEPAANDAFWRHPVVVEAPKYTYRSSGIDDQSLASFIRRISRTDDYSIHGFGATENHKIVWNLPWELSKPAISRVSTILEILIGMWLLYSWVRSRNRSPDGTLYSLILFTLIFFPHMQRYNHVLALPAMAWLWQGGTRGRYLSITAYALFALSRLNHVWAVYLPSVPASVASGFGLFGILVLFAGVTHGLWIQGKPADDGYSERVHRQRAGKSK